MVIYEILPHYPAVVLTSRQALKDVKIGGGGNLMPTSSTQKGSKKESVVPAYLPMATYITFWFRASGLPWPDLGYCRVHGVVCYEPNLSNFDLSLSPSYCHSPMVGLLLQPEHGVHLIVQKGAIEPLNYVLIFKSGPKTVGGALAIGISNWLNAIFLALYMMYSPSCAKIRVPVSTEFFQEIREFFRFAVPSAIMVCLQWWSYECVVLLSGLLLNPLLETSVLSVCLTTIATMYSIPFGLSASVSTRISNELGGGKPQAKLAVYAVMFLAVAELILVSGTLFATRSIFGYTFSNEKEVMDYVSSMAPLVCLSVIIDDLQGVLSGVARGTGWQHIGAYINLGALYLCGVPTAAALGFWFKFRTRALWIGIQIGAVLQTVVLAVVTGCTNWEKQDLHLNYFD